jgi:hypothetical protein
MANAAGSAFPDVDVELRSYWLVYPEHKKLPKIEPSRLDGGE